MTVVHHWHFNDGVEPVNPGNQFGEFVLPQGWYCWVYPKDDREFEEWMTRTCPSAEICHRFNSGDPMWTVYIADEKEAMLFKMRWL